MGRFAARKGYPLESVETSTGFVLGQEPSDGPVPTLNHLARIQLRVEIRGADLTRQQFEELAFVGRHCALANTLRRGSEIDDEFEWLR